MAFKERKAFSKLMQMAINRELSAIIVENRDRLSRFGFELIEQVFESLGTKVIVISNVENKSYGKELTDDLISIIHYYSVRSYSMRKRLHNAEQAIRDESAENN